LTAVRLASPRRFPLSPRMDLETAAEMVNATLERMRVQYTKPVFDEWMILTMSPGANGVLAYAGPREEAFRRELIDDVQPLRALTEGRQFTVGDFEFASDAGGPRHDALMKVGEASYLVCNNTGKTMAEIRADARWLKAQGAFFELGEKFRMDPLVG
jgi:hypothetical protein